MTSWERLEEWLFDHEGETFDTYRLSNEMKVTAPAASGMVQSYLSAQRRKHARTLYVLHREGRTTKAVWSFGIRAADARAIGNTLSDDVRAKVLRAFAPDLKRIATRNPRAARLAERQIHSVIDGALVILAAAVQGDDG